MTIEELEIKRLSIKHELEDGDYKILKCYEHYLMTGEQLQEYDLQALHNRREILRNEINVIDAEIAQLKKDGD